MEIEGNLVLKTALQYHDAGIQVLEIEKNSKYPSSSWGKQRFINQNTDDLRKMFDNKSYKNIAVLGGKMSDNFVPLDFDSRAGFLKALQYPQFQRIISKTPIVISANRKTPHVWIKTPVPVKGLNNKEFDVEARANSYCLAPPSRYREQHQYRFEFDNNLHIYTLQDLNEIPFLKFTQATEEYYRTLKGYDDAYYANKGLTYGIRMQKWNHIFYGDCTGYKTRSEADYAFCIAAICAGYSVDHVIAIYEELAKDGSKYREKGSQGKTYLRYTYESAYNSYMNTSNKIDQLVNSMEQAVLSYQFNSRTAYADMSVAMALVKIARRCGKLENIGASVRELSEMTGLGIATVSRSLTRIPFIIPGKRQDKSTAWCYSFNSDFLIEVDKKHKHNGLFHFEVKGIEHDLFTNAGIGKTGKVILSIMETDNGYHFDELQYYTALKDMTLRRKLYHLTELGLIYKNKKHRYAKYWLTEPVTPTLINKIADKMGITGTQNRRVMKHIDDRYNYTLFNDSRKNTV